LDDTLSKLRLAVFDCDGTLVDSQASIVSSMQAACAAHNIPEPEPEAIRRMVGLPLEVAIASLFPELDKNKVWQVREGYREAFTVLRQRGDVHEPLFQGGLDALRVLEDTGWILGVATGKSYKGLISTLDTHRLTIRFQTLQTADLAQGKPHPEMLLNAMAETGVDAASTVMIGDTTYDMEMAINAGTMALGVAWGYHESQELMDAGAHIVIDDFSQLPEAVERLSE